MKCPLSKAGDVGYLSFGDVNSDHLINWYQQSLSSVQKYFAALGNWQVDLGRDFNTSQNLVPNHIFTYLF